VPWEIKHREGDLYDLLNITETTKFGVLTSGPAVAGGPKTFDSIDGHSSVQFLIGPFGEVADHVDVTWHRREDLSGEPKVWRGARPPKT
jgi:hypothetical protein